MPFPDDLDTFLSAAPAAGGVHNKDIFENVWKIVQECGEEERHFNTLQSVYRGVASSWLLATFGAVGFLLFGKDGDIAHPWMAAAICILGALGISLLWMLDLHIYQRLLVAAFEQGRVLEDKFAWLPQIRNTMRKYTKDAQGETGVVLLFYNVGPGCRWRRPVLLARLLLVCRRFWGILVGRRGVSAGDDD